MKFENYLNPKKKEEESGPHKSLRARCKGVEAWQEAHFLKLSR